MLTVVIIFLALSLLAYALFGGADFGAGIIEIFAGHKTKHTITHAIAPVWEANHIWLILVVVILFMGFPLIYTQMSVYLHIPLVILLMGIVLRGTAFTFRHYDAVHDRSQKYYTFIFMVSSVVAPLLLGVIMGALILGRINPEATTFYEIFMAPWMNSFCWVLGVFTCCLFAFQAAVYLLGEAKTEAEKELFFKIARNANIATVLVGGMVFAAAEFNGFPLTDMFLNSVGALAAVILASLSLPILWWSLLRKKVILPRLLAGFQTFMILGAWFRVQYPVLLRYENGDYLGIFNTAAPLATMRQLALALLIGSLLILPALFYLLKTFKSRLPVQENKM